MWGGRGWKTVVKLGGGATGCRSGSHVEESSSRNNMLSAINQFDAWMGVRVVYRSQVNVVLFCAWVAGWVQGLVVCTAPVFMSPGLPPASA